VAWSANAWTPSPPLKAVDVYFVSGLRALDDNSAEPAGAFKIGCSNDARGGRRSCAPRTRLMLNAWALVGTVLCRSRKDDRAVERALHEAFDDLLISASEEWFRGDLLEHWHKVEALYPASAQLLMRRFTLNSAGEVEPVALEGTTLSAWEWYDAFKDYGAVPGGATRKDLPTNGKVQLSAKIPKGLMDRLDELLRETGMIKQAAVELALKAWVDSQTITRKDRRPAPKRGNSGDFKPLQTQMML
jgi:hypothetical protein